MKPLLILVALAFTFSPSQLDAQHTLRCHMQRVANKTVQVAQKAKFATKNVYNRTEGRLFNFKDKVQSRAKQAKTKVTNKFQAAKRNAKFKFNKARNNLRSRIYN